MLTRISKVFSKKDKSDGGPKVNSAGDYCQPGGTIGDGGDTTMAPENLFYCGKWKMQCRCGTCDGQCGPLSGCPCHSCIELVGFKVNRDGALCRKGVGQGRGVVEPRLKWCELYYCGKRKMECKCGDCGERCGSGSGGGGGGGLMGGSGCPCRACLDLVIETGMPAGGKVHDYDDLAFDEKKLTDNPPSSSLPNSNSGVNLVEPSAPPQQAQPGSLSLPPRDREGVGDDDGSLCVICLERRKQYLLLPCGHYSYCAGCVGSLQICAICRSHIDTKVKVYET